MPWHQRGDLRHFRALTLGRPVIMGRKTFAAIGKPLGGRDNIVVSRQPPTTEAATAAPASAPPAGATSLHWVASLEAAVELARSLAQIRGADAIMVIGGAEIYRQAQPLASVIHLTRVHARPDGDAIFADPPSDEWRQIGCIRHPAGPGDDHDWSAITLTRRMSAAMA